MKRETIARQRGATLITALVMLVVLTLLVISAISSSTTNLRIAGNMQMQEETVSAAQRAAENVISHDFTKLLVPQTIAVTIGPAQYNAVIPVPVCTGSAIMKRDVPNLPQACLGSPDSGGGPVYESGAAAAPDTQCAAQQWDVKATVADGNSGAQTALHQGVSLLVDSATPCNVQLP